MNGKHILLMLAHLFRTYGNRIGIEEAVHILSFRCRYGKPTDIRKILTLAEGNGMISVSEGIIRAEFLFDSQKLKPNQAIAISSTMAIKEEVLPLY